MLTKDSPEYKWVIQLWETIKKCFAELTKDNAEEMLSIGKNLVDYRPEWIDFDVALKLSAAILAESDRRFAERNKEEKKW